MFCKAFLYFNLLQLVVSIEYEASGDFPLRENSDLVNIAIGSVAFSPVEVSMVIEFDCAIKWQEQNPNGYLQEALERYLNDLHQKTDGGIYILVVKSMQLRSNSDANELTHFTIAMSINAIGFQRFNSNAQNEPMIAYIRELLARVSIQRLLAYCNEFSYINQVQGDFYFTPNIAAPATFNGYASECILCDV